MLQKSFLIASVLTIVSGRALEYIPLLYNYDEDSSNIIQKETDNVLSILPFEPIYPEYNLRTKRQAEGQRSLSLNGEVTGLKPDGSFNYANVGLSAKNENNKLGGFIEASHSPLFKTTEVSAGANVNLFSHKTYGNLDFSAGVRRKFSPFSNGSWRPNFGLGYSKSF